MTIANSPTKGLNLLIALAAGWRIFVPLGATLACAVISPSPAFADPTSVSPEVEIKKHSTGKEASVRQGEKEWIIYIDVDQDRTMILRTESDKGQEINNQAEIVDRPMSKSEVDGLVGDFVSGITSTLKP